MSADSGHPPRANGAFPPRTLPLTGGALALGLTLLLLALLLGAGLARLLAPGLPGDSSPEAGFARDMSVHHAQAVEMAEIVRDRTEDEPIRLLAADIALTQQAQIGRVQGWLDVWGLPATGQEPPMAWMGPAMSPMMSMPGVASRAEIARLQTLPPAEADRLFLRLMIPHHQAAVEMARAILARSPRPEVATLADAIVQSQQWEIEALREMLRQRGDASPP